MRCEPSMAPSMHLFKHLENNIMSKGQDKKRKDKNKPAKTVKEKQQAKKEKREKKENPGILTA